MTTKEAVRKALQIALLAGAEPNQGRIWVAPGFVKLTIPARYRGAAMRTGLIRRDQNGHFGITVHAWEE